MLEYVTERMKGTPVDFATIPNFAAQLRPALEGMRAQFPALAAAPPVIQESLLFPYLEGAGYVHRLWKQGERVAPFGESLPTSTEQILGGRADDTPVELAMSVSGGEVLHEDVLGRLELGVLLDQHLGPGSARFADGWGGDRYVLVDGVNGERGLIWYAVWDDTAARDRFAEHFRSALGSLGGAASLEVTEVDGHAATVLRVGRQRGRLGGGDRLASPVTDRVPAEAMSVEVGAGDVRYEVWVGSGLLGNLSSLLSKYAPAHRYALICDENVERVHGTIVLKALTASGVDARLYSFPAGEACKTRKNWSLLTDAMLDDRHGRDSCVVAVGGGVTGDLAGFVAATYLRGIPVVQVPTSYLAMIDASVGGKIGVDVPAGKNLVGSFHAPRVVVADTDTLTTLPSAERVRALWRRSSTARFSPLGTSSGLRRLRTGFL